MVAILVKAKIMAAAGALVAGGGGAATYTVHQGDTMSAIAASHGESLQQLEQANPQVTDPNLIVVGEQLHLGAQAGSASDHEPDGDADDGGGAAAPAPAQQPVSPSSVPSGGGGTPGTGLPSIFSTCIINAESSGQAHITSGLYGILPSTWASLGDPGGYATPGSAPVSVQNQAAQTLYDRYGLQPWSDPCTGH